MNDQITANMALWWAIGAAMTGGCLGFVIAALLAASTIADIAEDAFHQGYDHAVNDGIDENLVSDIRWECTASGAAIADAITPVQDWEMVLAANLGHPLPPDLEARRMAGIEAMVRKNLQGMHA